MSDAAQYEVGDLMIIIHHTMRGRVTARRKRSIDEGETWWWEYTVKLPTGLHYAPSWMLEPASVVDRLADLAG